MVLFLNLPQSPANSKGSVCENVIAVIYIGFHAVQLLDFDSLEICFDVSSIERKEHYTQDHKIH